jgi:predicted dehydrogenase
VGEACHAIDLCTALAGSPPVRVFAESVAKTGGLETTDDQVFITLRHQNGSISSVSYQTAGDRGAPAERVEVYGGGRTAIIDAWDRVSLHRGGQAKEERGGKDRGFEAELEGFVDACRKGGAWPVPWSEVHAVSWATLMAVRSVRTGAPVNIDDPSPEAEDPAR